MAELNGRFIPQWALDELETQRMRLREAAERIEELEAAAAGDGGSPFSYGSEIQNNVVTLPSHVRTMHVKLPDGFELYLSTHGKASGSVGREGYLEVMVSSHHGMSLLPQSGNVVHVGPRS